jgi:hypothetical protein
VLSYPKAVPDSGWVGLSEIVAHGNYVYIIERDNQIGGSCHKMIASRWPTWVLLCASLWVGRTRVPAKVLDPDPRSAVAGQPVVDKVRLSDLRGWYSVDQHPNVTVLMTKFRGDLLLVTGNSKLMLIE